MDWYRLQKAMNSYLFSIRTQFLSLASTPCSLSGILVVLNVLLNCSEQSGMIPMANCCKGTSGMFIKNEVDVLIT